MKPCAQAGQARQPVGGHLGGTSCPAKACPPWVDNIVINTGIFSFSLVILVLSDDGDDEDGDNTKVIQGILCRLAPPGGGVVSYG